MELIVICDFQYPVSPVASLVTISMGKMVRGDWNCSQTNSRELRGNILGVKNQGTKAKGETWVREGRCTSTLRTQNYIQQHPQVLECM